MLDDYARERQARESTEAAQAREAAARERRCALARRRQQATETANFLYDYDARGERRVLDGADYDAAIAQVRGAVQEACGAGP